MQTITARNPAEGIRIAVRRATDQARTADIGGKAFLFEQPLLINFTHPKECFASDPALDLNPFTALEYTFTKICGRERSLFSDSSIHLKNTDMLVETRLVSDVLRVDPDCMDAVIDCDDLMMFKVRHDCLDLIVTNASSDIRKNMFGYDAVANTIIQRVISDRIGILVGRYWACCNNAYLRDQDNEAIKNRGGFSRSMYPVQTYKKIVSNAITWDQDLKTLMDSIERLQNGESNVDLLTLRNGFLGEVVFKALLAYAYFLRGEFSAAWLMADLIGDVSWREFCTDWLTGKGCTRNVGD